MIQRFKDLPEVQLHWTLLCSKYNEHFCVSRVSKISVCFQCPFHGPIVARDKTGKCTNARDAERCSKEAEKSKQCPDWQDPQLLEDIKVTETHISHILHYCLLSLGSKLRNK